MNTLKNAQSEELLHGPLAPLKIGQHTSLYPIIQGGMGVRVSTPEMAAAVILSGGIGTLSSVGLPFSPEYKDFYDETLSEAYRGELGILDTQLREIQQRYKSNTKNNPPIEHQESLHKDIKRLEREINRQKSDIFMQVNAECIRRDIQKTRELTGGKGPLFINIMCAASGYETMVRAACEAGVDGIVSGAGLPTSLPELTKNYPNIALIPILSSHQGVSVITRQWWKKYGKRPDAIVLEDPSTAGGHLGAKGKIFENIHSDDSTLVVSIPATVEYLKNENINIPVIGAGGVVTQDDIRQILGFGASGVQIGTLFAASHESGFKKEVTDEIITAGEKGVQEYMSSAGLPARALSISPIFDTIKDIEAKKRFCDKNCLEYCGFLEGNGNLAQMCILQALTAGLKGSVKTKWLGFVGASVVRVKTSKSVENIMNDLVGKD